MAVSATIIVRSALSVLLEEVKSEGMRGNAETVLEMFETVMLSLKPNDDAFHKQVVALLISASLHARRVCSAVSHRPDFFDRRRWIGSRCVGSRQREDMPRKYMSHPRGMLGSTCLYTATVLCTCWVALKVLRVACDVCVSR